eukprot:Pgem_evm1s12413
MKKEVFHFCQEVVNNSFEYVRNTGPGIGTDPQEIDPHLQGFVEVMDVCSYLFCQDPPLLQKEYLKLPIWSIPFFQTNAWKTWCTNHLEAVESCQEEFRLVKEKVSNEYITVLERLHSKICDMENNNDSTWCQVD